MISPNELARAAEAIRAGKLVAFPTETVYGLGANALDPEAVARIYAAKGRPATSPLIVHVASVSEARDLAAEWPQTAQLLVDRFWPGPLTIVLQKNLLVPDVVSAGLDTVGLRMPANDIALRLIEMAGVPIAAPSANRFTELSPTTAEHVCKSLGSEVELILDGGPSRVGIESTVVAITSAGVEILRPGMITGDEIQSVVGPLTNASVSSADTPHRSPGQHVRHYQPRTTLLVTDTPPCHGRGTFLSRAEMPLEPRAYAALLYTKLHSLDGLKLDWIAIAPVPQTSEWDGIRDRLERARQK